MPHSPGSTPARYGLAVAAAVLAVAARLALDPWLGNLFPFATLFLGILIVAGYAGCGPALVTTGLGSVAIAYFLLRPRYSLAVASPADRIGLALYLVVGAGTALLGGRLREALRRSEDNLDASVRQGEWLRITLASIGEAVIVADAEGRITSMNPVAEALTAWPEAAAVGLPLRAVCASGEAAAATPAAAGPARIVVDPGGRGVLVARDGTARRVESSDAPIRLADGTVAGSVLVFRDVTTRHEADLALARSEQRLRLALDAARMVSWQWSPADGKLQTSENAAAVFGLRPGAPLERIDQGLALVHPDDLPGYEATFGRAIEDRAGYLTQYRIVRPDDGAVLWMEERGHVVADEATGGMHLVGVVGDITDRKRAEEELLAARSRLDSLLAVGEVGTWEYDLAGDVVRADGNLARIYGVAPAVVREGPVDRFLGFIHPDDRPRVFGAVAESLDSGDTYDTQYRVVTPDGATRWVVARARFRRDGSGRATGLAGVLVDITSQKRAEDALRDTRSRLESTLAAAEVGTWEYDVAANTVRADDNLANLFGVTPEQAAGGPLDAYTKAIHPDDRGRVGAAIGRALEAEDWYETEYRVANSAGAFRWVVARGRVIRDGAGRAVRLPGVVVDITARKQAEQRLRESEARFRALFDSMDEGFCVIEMIFDPAGRPVDYRFLEMNPAFGRHTGLGESLGRTIREITPGLEASWFETYGRVARTGEPIRFVSEAQALGRWFDVYAFRLGGEGSPKVAVLFNDITAGKRAEVERSRLEHDLRRLAADLSEADRRKDEFLATLAHELRNPLAPIRNGLEIMKRAGDDRRAIDESRTLMERQVAHMVRLIDDLMDVSRITRNKLELRRERVDLAGVVRQAVETSRPLFDAAGHGLSVTLPDRPVLVDADVTRLAQVFANLLNNAAKYTDPGGAIALAAEVRGDEVVVAIRDNGVGIPAEMLPDVFTMFTQVDRSLERAQGGLGIGLSLVKTLVGMHGGAVEARSEGHGLGSEFVVRLPVAAAEATRPAPPAAAEAPDGAPSPLRILVVDDNRDSARTLARLLRLLGHETRTAHDGGEAVAAAEEYRPDLMLLDIGMPVMNGFEVARTIRDRPWGGDVRIVALTGWGQEGDRRRSDEAGFDRHLVKPVDPAELEDLLADLRPGPAAVAGDGP